MLEYHNYDKYLLRVKNSENKRLIKNSFAVGMIYFIIFGFYAYSFYFGGFLRIKSIEDQGNAEYSGGKILTIMFCIFIGAM